MPETLLKETRKAGNHKELDVTRGPVREKPDCGFVNALK